MDKKARKLYRVIPLMDGVYGISSSAVMCYLLVGKTGAMLIDTAYGFEDLSEVVKEITTLPVTVVNSHGHVDHSGGNFFFGTPVYIHKADVEVYRRHNQPAMHRLMERTLSIFELLIFWRTIVPKDPERNDEQRASFDNWLYLKEGDVFDLGGLTAKVIEIPGHTQGSVAMYFPEKKLMVTSDGANPATWLFLPESAKLSVYLESLKKLKAYSFDHILTGHSSILLPKAVLDAWIHVAETPDLAGGKKRKEEAFAPGVHPITCWASDDPKHKGPNIVLDPLKADVRSQAS